VQVVADLKKVLDAARPQVIYTHNLADKHDTTSPWPCAQSAPCAKLPKEARSPVLSITVAKFGGNLRLG